MFQDATGVGGFFHCLAFLLPWDWTTKAVGCTLLAASTWRPIHVKMDLSLLPVLEPTVDLCKSLAE